VEQVAPQARVLQRYGGGWRIEEQLEGRQALLSVDEPEVFGWYGALHDAEVSLEAEATPWPDAADVELRVVTDSTATLRVRCVLEPRLRCRRDDGPVLRVRTGGLSLAFDADTFAERRLTDVRSEDVRAIEVLAGPADPGVLRQSTQLDLGVWRLDAPVHPEGDAALDGVQLETLLGTLGGLRAEAWVDEAADRGALRRIRVEQVPRRGLDAELVVELLPECVVRVSGHRPARVSAGVCETLGLDLLVRWPLQRSLDLARGLELTEGGQTTRLERRGEAWAEADGSPAPRANAWLEAMHARTAARVRQGTPPSEPRWHLHVLPGRGTAYAFEGDARWARLEGAPWFYALDEEDAASDGDGEGEDDEGDEDAPQEAAPE
ncbi:MAG: hypothetical protein KDK70_35465, partial [Myxococcales bacterium]|nr:hypothetical protein [Myxococcales bacterium]